MWQSFYPFRLDKVTQFFVQIMKRIGSSSDIGSSRSSRLADYYPRERDLEEKARRRREWRRQQELERQHERLKRKKIEEYERNRKALKAQELKKRTRRSSHRSSDRSQSSSPNNRGKDKSEASTFKTSVMSQK